ASNPVGRVPSIAAFGVVSSICMQTINSSVSLRSRVCEELTTVLLELEREEWLLVNDGVPALLPCMNDSCESSSLPANSALTKKQQNSMYFFQSSIFICSLCGGYSNIIL